MFRFASCGTFCTALLAFAAIGCSGEDEETAPQVERVEILTAWNQGGEKDALDKLIEIHTARRPNAEITSSSEPDRDSFNERLTTRMNDRNPPDTFPSNMGERLKVWVKGGASRLAPVEQGNWSMPQELLNVNSYNGELYGVPISLIRQSSFYYNIDVLAEHEIDPESLNIDGPDGVQALLDACATLRAGGIEYPFALGNQWDWTLDMLFWENLFPALVTPEYYTAFWKGEANPESDAELDDALAVLLELSQYFNPDSADIDFPEGLDRIAIGEESVFGQQGDWGTGVLIGMTDADGNNKGYQPGTQFGVMPFPGTAKRFIFSQDVFPIAAGTPNRAATQELLNTIASEELQIEFNLIKGSLPARDDINIEATDLTDVQKATYNQFKASDTVKLPVVHGFKPDDVMKDLAKEMKAMVATGDTSDFKDYLVANYSLLEQ